MTENALLILTLIILFIPLASFILLLAVGRRLPRQGDTIATGLMFLGLGLSLLLLIVVLNRPVADAIPGFPVEPMQLTFQWVDFNSTMSILDTEVPLRIELGIMIDNLVAIMLVVVMLITALVHLFSIGYMRGDAKYCRYFAYLGLFAFSMLGIVVTNNLLMMYASWELVGLSSYLLIGFWYEKPKPAYAGTKAFLVNRVGDIGMWIGILVIFAGYGTFRFDEIFAAISLGQLPFASDAWLTAAGILIFLGAVGKSAQVPLHTWLPDAMEGPTPVSALIHAATMVAAGVYLVARVFPMLTGDALLVIAVVGTTTAFVAATIAIVQYDIKKVLAYSTISQLGYMIMALGVGAYTAGFFHLVTHAMFKACLFLGSGSVIHAMHNSLHRLHDHDTDAQDIRNMGGLIRKMPVTFATFLVATLAISGAPLFSGFLSKDEILAAAWAFGSLNGSLATAIPWVGFTVATLTAFYMFRLLFLTFLGDAKRADVHEHIRESPYTMKIPLIVLAVLSLWFFYSWNPFSGFTGWFEQSIHTPVTVTGGKWYNFPVMEHAFTSPRWDEPGIVDTYSSLLAEKTTQEALEVAVHKSHLPAMITSLLVATLGILLAFLVYHMKVIDTKRLAKRYRRLYDFLMNKWYFDEIYEKWIVVPFVHAVSKSMAWFDSTIVDGIVNGAATITEWQSRVSGFFDKWVVDGLVNLSAYMVGFGGIVLKKTQSGRIQTYIAWILAGVVVLIFAFF